MTFTASALLLAWVAIVLLALGLAGLLRQVSVLTRQLESGTAPTGPGALARGTGGRGARTTRELVGFRLPDEVAGQLLAAGTPPRTVVAFISPGCSSCSQTLHALAADQAVAAGRVGLTLVSTGSCEPGLADTGDLDASGRVTCLPQGRDLMDRLAVPATPYLLVLDARGTLLDVLLPDEDTDLAAWLRQTPGLLAPHTPTAAQPRPEERA